MGGCQNYGPFLGPYYNTAPNIWDIQTGAIILTTTHMSSMNCVSYIAIGLLSGFTGFLALAPCGHRKILKGPKYWTSKFGVPLAPSWELAAPLHLEGALLIRTYGSK